MSKTITVAVVDGQGGGIGSIIIERLKSQVPNIKIQALGTNSSATKNMLKAGADEAATGENAIVYNVKDADIIMGVVAILMPDSMMGELSPKMAEAIGSSHAMKILIPLTRCNIRVALPGEYNLQECVDYGVELVNDYINNLE
ncbi:DUF3842 family protein [Anaerosalibacter sp. Marseille-P3206]|uniref:DUF3842 family protein n=1 Tax=Anaerosalibacter sp. Marseille-P3206 TaxID=1871005 RepID=UPI00190EDB0E|nr:DUF3842 family protein [Anaerosalibacter sp. Marseille-P3206]